LKKAAETGIAYEESSQFEYTPGKGVSAICESDEVIVGSRNFLVERGIALSHGNAGSADAEVFVARKG
jgi:cation transport ATPase